MSLKYEIIRTKVHLYYYRHREYHRISKPALISQHHGSYYWMEYNLLHRLTGPADISHEDKKVWYFIRGKNYTQEEYESEISKH